MDDSNKIYKPTESELRAILEAHAKWRRGEADGKRANLARANLTDANLADANLADANLTGANLMGANLADANLARANLMGANLTDANLADANLADANLTGANLMGANLTDANLARANLMGANLTDANLARANLTGANLARANLTGAKNDLHEILGHAANEAAGLLEALRGGKIDGSVYTGDCACLVGTIAKVRGVSHLALPGITPDGGRPAERLFLSIRKGDTPETNAVAKIVDGWIAEWIAARGGEQPTVASAEAQG